MTKQGGLAGVVAGESAICTVGIKGTGLHYRGFEIRDLATHCEFEEVAYLLIHGTLPNQHMLDQYRTALQNQRAISQDITALAQRIPQNSHPMDMLRTICSYLGCGKQPQATASDKELAADQLLVLFAGIIAYWHQFHVNNKTIDLMASKETSLAGYFLETLLQRNITALERDTINTALILYAEHEFNASTFAARVTAATLSDFYASICSAIGTLRGPLHGGANEEALKLILQYESVDEARAGIQQKLANKELIMGFGHRVYTSSDPRSDIIKEKARELAVATDNLVLFQIAETIEKEMWDQKNLFPNLDFYSAIASICVTYQ